MENNFSDIQQLWQSQKATNLDIDTLIKGLKKTESKQRREQLFLMIITPLTIGILFWSMPWRESLGIEISLYLIAFAMIWVLGLAIRSRIKTFDLTEQYSNEDYLNIQIKKLKSRYKIASKYMYGYALLLVVALNISYYILLEPLTSWIRIVIHLILTFSVLGFMHWQTQRKVKKYDRELKPMIAMMQAMLQDKLKD